MKPYFILLFLIGLASNMQAQPDWKLINNKNGIKVYTSKGEHSEFKSIRVLAAFDGTIVKLMNVLGNIGSHPEWVYKTKSASILKQVSPYEFVYYTETILPWPLSNRDAIIHLAMVPDTVRHELRINAFSEPNYIVKKDGLVRIPYSKASWFVMERANQIHIEYIFDVDPGGKLPAWLVNMMIDKGPFESFLNLKSRVKN